jgi:hypothetical protein
MTRFLNSIAEYIGIGLVFLGAILVYGTLRANNFNRYIFGTGILLIVIPIAVYLIIARIKDRGTSAVRFLKDLKSTGIIVPVDLTSCNVKSNNWTTEVERYNSPRVVLLNEISGHGDKNVERVESNVSRIEYTCDFNGRPRTFLSPTIAKDKITLQLLLEMQKETAIYVDRDDNQYYYFDLEFIDQ